MAIGKPRGKKGMRPIYVLVPKFADPVYLRSLGLTEKQIARAGHKIYITSRPNRRGPGGAEEVEREWQTKLSGGKQSKSPSATTVSDYAAQWLTLHHGKDTRRPAKATYNVNEYNLRAFLEMFGDRSIEGGIQRGEALAWSKKNQTRAKTVSAMFNDAVDDEVCTGNPFKNRRQEQGRGRKDITPITETEVDTLARIALDMWGAETLGLSVRAMILFGAWVGCRPGETWGVTLQDMNFEDSEVTIRRVKRRGGVHPVDVVAFPRVPQDAVRAMADIPTVGPVFRTARGLTLNKTSHRYLWDPVRKAFEQTLTSERRVELRAGRPDIDAYELRHFCASVLADRGCTAQEIAGQLGNSAKVCESTYIHSFRDRANERVRNALDQPAVVDLDAARRRRDA